MLASLNCARAEEKGRKGKKTEGKGREGNFPTTQPWRSEAIPELVVGKSLLQLRLCVTEARHQPFLSLR